MSELNNDDDNDYPQHQFQSKTLVISGIGPQINEVQIFEHFCKNGITSIRVCRDTKTRKSLRYGYINFYSYKLAHDALNNFIFTKINGFEINLMYKVPRGIYQKWETKNKIIVAKMPQIIMDLQFFHETMSVFGDILEAKIYTDKKSKSFKYGTVYYIDSKNATKAVSINGMIVQNEKLSVMMYKDELMPQNSKVKTKHIVYDVMVENIPRFMWTDKQIVELFETVTNYKVYATKWMNNKLYLCFWNEVYAKKVVEIFNECQVIADKYGSKFNILRVKNALIASSIIRKNGNHNIWDEKYNKLMESIRKSTFILMINNVSFMGNTKHIRKRMNKYGNVVDLKVFNNGNSVIVTYDEESAVLQAINAMNVKNDTPINPLLISKKSHVECLVVAIL